MGGQSLGVDESGIQKMRAQFLYGEGQVRPHPYMGYHRTGGSRQYLTEERSGYIRLRAERERFCGRPRQIHRLGDGRFGRPTGKRSLSQDETRMPVRECGEFGWRPLTVCSPTRRILSMRPLGGGHPTYTRMGKGFCIRREHIFGRFGRCVVFPLTRRSRSTSSQRCGSESFSKRR